MSVKFVFEGVKFVLQHNCFLQLRVNRDVLDWSQLISPESTQMKMNGRVHMQLFSHLRMKITTSSIIFGNSLIVLCSWSDIGTSSSLSSWPVSTWMLFARFFIASCNSFWVFTCCQNNQSSYWCWKQKRANFIYDLDTREYGMCDGIYLLQVRQHTGIIVKNQSPCWWRSLEQKLSQHCLQKQNNPERTVTRPILPPASWSVDPRHSDQCCDSTIVF